MQLAWNGRSRVGMASSNMKYRGRSEEGSKFTEPFRDDAVREFQMKWRQLPLPEFTVSGTTVPSCVSLRQRWPRPDKTRKCYKTIADCRRDSSLSSGGARPLRSRRKYFHFPSSPTACSSPAADRPTPPSPTAGENPVSHFSTVRPVHGDRCGSLTKVSGKGLGSAQDIPNFSPISAILQTRRKIFRHSVHRITNSPMLFQVSHLSCSR